jgi:hypothetical protein
MLNKLNKIKITFPKTSLPFISEDEAYTYAKALIAK